MKIKFYFVLSISLILSISASNAATIANDYLSKPTGSYGIGFKDFHWINQHICLDPNFTGKNQNDFSTNNPSFCHEIMARIYYPTFATGSRAPYYQPIIKDQQDSLRQVPIIPQAQIEQLSQLKSFSIEKAPLVEGKRFPVLLYSPGFGCPAELYENFMTELVSHGYIVVSINTSFVNPAELPNGHLVKSAEPKSREEIENIFIPLVSQDLSYVFEQIHILHHSNSLFAAMDLNNIGVFGHSIGGRVLADISHANPTWFQAAVTLDIGFDQRGASTKKFDFPFMHLIAASRKKSVIPVEFELGNNGYLIGMSPNEENLNYSSHMSFSDISTLQYHPALLTYQDYRRLHALDGFSLKLMSHKPTDQDCKGFDKATYVLIKKENGWGMAFYQDQKKVTDIPTKLMKGLDTALAALPNKAPEQLSDSDVAVIKKIVMDEHKLNVELTGTGNGWEITDSINTYLLKFFDHFLKHHQDPAFKKCTVLAKNTYIKCGPE